MTTSIVQEPIQTIARDTEIPPHFLIIGKKNALDYIAPALFRIGTIGELVVRAKGSMSIVTAVNVAEMVKKDIAGLDTHSISVGTEETVIEGISKRVSYIEIHLAKVTPQAPLEIPHDTEEKDMPQDKLAETASTAKKIRAKAKKSTTAKKRASAKRQIPQINFYFCLPPPNTDRMLETIIPAV